ncbi:hypothetical protein PG999_003514 [Apiospora kogelbergensis]|uniref:AAA+ ATPase domain-containing protein n=1 Tax=Apiospora kogelbergensis TaxID=1337665 RepID=A0AAW0R3X9_9PEZI
MAGNGGEVATLPTTKVHPFFSAPKSTSQDTSADVVRPVTPDPSCSPNSDRAAMVAGADDLDELAGDSNPKPSEAQPRRKRRKADTDATAACSDQPSKKTAPRAKRRCRDSAASSILDHFGSKDGQASSDTGSLDGQSNNGDVTSHLQTEAIASRSQANLSSNLENRSQEIRPAVKWHKLLRLNPKTGTIGSPPKSQDNNEGKVDNEVKPAVKSKRGRKPKPPSSRIVTIRYGVDEPSQTRICEAIESIYSGVRFVPTHTNTTKPSTADEQTTAEKPQTPKKSAALKTSSKTSLTTTATTGIKTGAPTHPFFAAKPKQSSLNTSSTPVNKLKYPNVKSAEKKHTIFTSTPCSPKQTKATPFSKTNVPQFGSQPGGLKMPGSQHPAWPSKGMAHIHGDERDESVLSEPNPCGVSLPVPHRKAKGSMVRLAPGESVLSNVTLNLGLDILTETLQALKTVDFQPPNPALRVPERHLESGLKLQCRIRPELRTWQAGFGKKPHPAIIQVYSSLETSLSAFDQSKCENVAWAQKYAPNAAAQVLQSSKDAILLRDWLQTLKVQSVNTGVTDASKSKAKPTAPVKKRKKGKKLDDFIVEDDAEENDLAEVSGDDEADWVPQGSQGGAKKTVVKAASKEPDRLTNAVVISGPHGCGKTAAVYAIAKELDFEIFEISPGSRRSGKDILERIGDMTRNHLVQHKQGEVEPAGIEAPDDDEVTRDLKSGKQGTMTTFFNVKPKTSAQQPRPAAKPAKANPIAKTLGEKSTKTLAGKGQKQSLILLEEVDILYEEDKQFWATVISLMIQSKRPFIMTCNDESLVPLQNLNLYGIFRFSKPPKDLAVDLLLLIAANEGHALRRRAVETLFDSRHQDLRASITELNYWCQIGIGDLRGGFGWRLHKGVEDVKPDNERKVRVVSTNTYEPGMGWLSRDPLLESCAYRTVEEEAQQQLWDGWSLDYGDLVYPSTRESSSPEGSRAQRLAELEAVDAFSDMLSAADICSSDTYSAGNGAVIDHSVPDLPLKAREDFVIGRRLLEAETSTRYDLTSMHIALSLKSLAKDVFACGQLPRMTDTRPLTEDMAPPYSSPSTTRYDYSLAFDAIAEAPTHSAAGYLDPSVFDRTMRLITLDVAPYVRSIVAYDQRLQEERLQRSNLFSEGGQAPKKRMRTTRAALSALEGGSRASTRRERYFAESNVNPELVLRTGGEDWASIAAAAASGGEEQQQQQPPQSRSRSSSEDCDGDTDMDE